MIFCLKHRDIQEGRSNQSLNNSVHLGNLGSVRCHYVCYDWKVNRAHKKIRRGDNIDNPNILSMLTNFLLLKGFLT